MESTLGLNLKLSREPESSHFRLMKSDSQCFDVKTFEQAHGPLYLSHHFFCLPESYRGKLSDFSFSHDSSNRSPLPVYAPSDTVKMLKKYVSAVMSLVRMILTL